jgi:Flp pilus assembly protein TadD
MNIRRYATAVVLAFLLIVTGCKAADTPLAGKALDSLAGKSAATEERLSTAAANAIAEGKTDEALALYERLYTRNSAGFSAPGGPFQEIALNYAQLLRKTGKAQRALAVLSPFLEVRHGHTEIKIDTIILNEYAAINIELGNLEKAEEILNRVLADEKAKRFHGDAYNLLGIALDAQGKHKEAEQLFRKSLTLWKGEETSVMNNLAVCLASQGRFDESLMLLNQALVMAPEKQEIARNSQMVKDLRESIVPKPPVETPQKKQKK